ncbi:hypothetical protein TNCV_4775531 [Trichonephila clavipes]|nr:hypothetical protein TNCV_4775531 [Trichonephila clavipes]
MLSRICGPTPLRAVQKHQITSKEQLKSVLQEEWLNIAPDTPRHLVESIPRRLEAVISAKAVVVSTIQVKIRFVSNAPSVTRGLATIRPFKVPLCCKSTVHLHTSMPSPGSSSQRQKPL